MRRMLFVVVCLTLLAPAGVALATLSKKASGAPSATKHHAKSLHRKATGRVARKKVARHRSRTTGATAEFGTIAARATSAAATTATGQYLLGEQLVQVSTGWDSAGKPVAFPFTAVSSGSLSSMSIYLDSRNSATAVVVGLYGDSSGRPGALLTSGTIGSPQAGTWNVAQVSSATVTAGQAYWIAAMGRNGTLAIRSARTSGCGSRYGTKYALSALPLTWRTGGSTSQCTPSAFASGTVSAPPPPPGGPNNTAPPVISGNPWVGQTLTTTNGSWDASVLSYAYQWQDCASNGANCTNIPTGVSSSYTLSASDVGHTIRVVVSAVDLGGTDSATSGATGAIVSSAPQPPAKTSPPTISGTAQQGDTLTASPGAWSGDTPMSFSYRWSDGTTGQTDTLPSADVGQTVSVTVTATNDAGNASATSAGVGPVTAPPSAPVPPSNKAAPTISGTPQVGDTLTASPGTWSGDTPMTFAYRWSDGTTGQTDTLPSADVGQTVSVTVTATNDAGNASTTSAGDGPVTSAPSSGNCTVTESSVSSVNAALTPGAIVCLAAGSYGSLSITANPSSNATVTAAPGAHVVVAGVNLNGSNITVSQLHSTGGITINNGGSNDTIDHNDVTEAKCGYGIAVFGTYTGSSFNPVANHDVISWNKIHDTGTTCEADALRIQGYANITIVHNDEYNLADPNQYHTDTLQSYQAGVPTSGLVYSYNYAHDLANAGPPFLKDGDVQNVTVTDNLVLRNSWTGIGGMDLHENTTGLVYRNNTELGTSGIVVQGQGSAPNPSLLFDHNVVDNANTSGSTGYTITSDYNEFVDNDEFSWTLGAHDIKGAPAGGYKCGSSCGNGTAAGDDYELANNPNGEGIDWNPAAQQYGPTN